MTKNILKSTIFLTILSIMVIAQPAFAATLTPAPTDDATPSITPKATAEAEVEKIKDLVASKVATLKLVEKRGVIGTVKSASNTEISITDSAGQPAKVDIDELTKFNSASEKEDFGISDIKKGDTLSFVGLYNKETKRLLARFVAKATNIPQHTEGQVIEKDTKEYTITIANNSGKKETVSIESSTKTLTYEDGDLVKAGFSKIEVGDRVVVVGFADPKVTGQINAERIIRLVGIPGTAGMKKVAGSATTSVTETTAPTAKPTGDN